jgi:anti-sigma B factor antagonist
MRLHQRQSADVSVVDLSGDGIGAEPSTLKQLITSLLAAGHRHIVLNVGELLNMDSTGIAEIVATYKVTRDSGGELKIAGAKGHVRRLLGVTRVETFISLYESEAEAIASFNEAETRTL